MAKMSGGVFRPDATSDSLNLLFRQVSWPCAPRLQGLGVRDQGVGRRAQGCRVQGTGGKEQGSRCKGRLPCFGKAATSSQTCKGANLARVLSWPTAGPRPAPAPPRPAPAAPDAPEQMFPMFCCPPALAEEFRAAGVHEVSEVSADRVRQRLRKDAKILVSRWSETLSNMSL
jgi:hypothetical protein